MIDYFKNHVLKQHPEYDYLRLLKRILKEGASSGDRTGTGTYKVFGHQNVLDVSTDKLPLLTTKKTNFRFIAEELVWFLQGSTNVKHLQEKNVPIWNGNGSAEECAKFGREEGDMGPIYGHQWRNFGATLRVEALKEDMWSEEHLRWVNRSYNDDGLDQIKKLVEEIQSNPNSRRHIVCAWHPKESGIVNPPPCHSLFQVQVDNGVINLLLWQRSSDVFLAKNYNEIGYILLLKLLAMVTNLKAGKFIHQIGDAHLYSDHIEQAKLQITRTPMEYPTLKINERLRGTGFEGLVSIKYEDFELKDYKAHKHIKAKMSV